MVWARRDVVAMSCPKSVISAQSLEYLERFRIWKQFGVADIWDLDAKTADAMGVLDDAFRKELNNGE